MADHRFSTPPKYPAMSNDNSGLEPVPVSGLESAAPATQDWAYYQQEKEAYDSSAPAWSVGAEEASMPVDGQGAAGKPRILGLSVRAFWTVVIVLVVVLAGAIGAGIGGGMAARSRDSSGSNPAALAQTQTPSSSSPPPFQTSSPSSSPQTTSSSTSLQADANNNNPYNRWTAAAGAGGSFRPHWPGMGAATTLTTTMTTLLTTTRVGERWVRPTGVVR